MSTRWNRKFLNAKTFTRNSVIIRTQDNAEGRCKDYNPAGRARTGAATMEGVHSTMVQADSRRPRQDAPCSTVHDIFISAKIGFDYSLLPPQVFERIGQSGMTQIHQLYTKARRIFVTVVHTHQKQRNRTRTIRHESGL